ncbi:MAG: bifunctional hydroxymethylpyrimidine kinase/phosphomethylpyrimidine kinase [Rudanella sp.]|nr:bifunctional hydroxymethylpyrimidine kinase/phosphomethylpyrimidine kinase [Rudanella sp.]
MTTETQPPITKILVINSFPANGNAGLKMVMSVLGTHVIPVPTLLLSGIGNMPGFQRFTIPFAKLLDSTLTLARQNGQSLVVYVGYLGGADQAEVIADAIIHLWHHLLTIADLVLPNFTETALLTGVREDIVPENAETYLSAFRELYPAPDCIVTGIRSGDQVINRWVRADTGAVTDFAHPYYPRYFSGTGDLFASVVIRFLCLENQLIRHAIENAGQVLETFIRHSVEAGRADLLITPELPHLSTNTTNA